MSGVTSLLSSAQITSLIQQASTAYQAPATALQSQEQPIQTQISALGKVQSALSSLQSALGGLADVQTLARRSVTASPNGTVSATVTNDATPGTYNLTNIQLAQPESLISSGFASASSSLGAGSITIQVGTGPAVTVNIASGQDNLTGIASAINQANAGVQATIVYDGSSYHLSLTGDSTGTAGAFTVTGSGGLAGFSSGVQGSGLTQIEAATDASFSLNGIPITSSSNTVSGVVPGLTLNLTASGVRHGDRSVKTYRHWTRRQTGWCRLSTMCSKRSTSIRPIARPAAPVHCSATSVCRFYATTFSARSPVRRMGVR